LLTILYGREREREVLPKAIPVLSHTGKGKKKNKKYINCKQKKMRSAEEEIEMT
jgi:hypothetical protein